MLLPMFARNFSRLRRLSFLFMGNMSPYYFKTIFRLCMKCMPSFIKIGGAVSEKNNYTRHTFVVLYIGFTFLATGTSSVSEVSLSLLESFDSADFSCFSMFSLPLLDSERTGNACLNSHSCSSRGHSFRILN